MVFVVMTAVTGYAKESIIVPGLTIKVNNTFGEGEIIKPDFAVTAAECELKEVIWNKDIESWKPGRIVRVKLIVISDSKVFANSYNSKECKVTGADFVSAKALDNQTLEISLNYTPVITLGTTEEAGWSDQEMKKALWKKVPYATGYELTLYADEKRVAKLKTETNSIDTTKYMTKEAYYYYEVKAIGYSSEDRKYLKEGKNVRSDEVILDATMLGGWRGNSYDDGYGNLAKSTWKLIMDKWYYFDAQGQKTTGWQNVEGVWYYLNSNGVMQTGWQHMDNKWYYLNPYDGAMSVGWVQVEPTKWYYFYQDGSRASSVQIGDYWLDPNGVWIS